MAVDPDVVARIERNQVYQPFATVDIPYQASVMISSDYFDFRVSG